MSEDIQLPPELGGYRLPGTPKSLTDVEVCILADVESAELGCLPIRHITRKYHMYSRKYGLPVTDLLNRMAEDGQLGIYRFNMLGRTFLFERTYFDTLIEQYKGGESPWENLASALKDVK